ncbi:hypothetical protein PY093_01800 [Cytobacillus sp. S13-E01]|nr:hypothetical protein [Cytobacillus sp. S13-E01]MDF0725443.1 hypothetical protein [Cytobacillus sp. S13-E01]
MAKKGRQTKISQEVANPSVSAQDAEFAGEIAGTPKKEKKKRR